MAGTTTGSLFTDPGVTPKLVQQYGQWDCADSTVSTTGTGAQREVKGAHGQVWFEYYIDEEVTLSLSGATSDTTATIPVGTCHVFTATRVTTTLAGNSVSNYSLGISGSATRFQGTTTNITSGDTNNGSCQADGTTPYTSATAIRITADQTVTSGKIRVVARCVGFRAPTS